MPPLAPTASMDLRHGTEPVDRPVGGAPPAVGRDGGGEPPIPTLHDVLRARRVVDRFLPRTPLLAPPALAEKLGCQIHVKC